MIVILISSLGFWTAATHDQAEAPRMVVKEDTRTETPRPALPRVDMRNFVTQEDYPPNALVRREQGNVVVQLAVSEKGLVTSCSIIHSSGSAELDMTSCGLLRWRARFFPAVDAQGQPAATAIAHNVSWTLPAEQ